MPRELSDEEKAGRQERVREWYRAYYQANKERLTAQRKAYYQAHRDEILEKRRDRRRQFRCDMCGEHLPFNIRIHRKTLCQACRKKRRDAGAARRAAKLRAELEAYGTPVCPRCGGTNIARHPKPKEGRRFYCRDCHRAGTVLADPKPGPNPYPCPYCDGRCKKAGIPWGAQRFQCTKCGRSNTMLRPNPKPNGPLRHAFGLVLGVRANRRLNAICQARGWSQATAVREIFRKHAIPPTSVVAHGQEDEWMIQAHLRAARAEKKPSPPPLRFTEATLTDARPENMRKQWVQKKAVGLEGCRLHRPIGKERQINVRLDDEAWEGLHRVMQAMQATHQDAARWMILQEPP